MAQLFELLNAGQLMTTVGIKQEVVVLEYTPSDWVMNGDYKKALNDFLIDQMETWGEGTCGGSEEGYKIKCEEVTNHHLRSSGYSIYQDKFIDDLK